MFVYACGNNLDDWLRIGFSNILSTNSLELTDKFDESDALVVINWNPRFKRLLRKARKAKKLTFLVVTEPGAVIAQHSMDNFKVNFSDVIEIGRAKGPETICYFQDNHLNYFEKALAERKSKTVAIAANKSSFLKGELYGLRRKTFSTQFELDVFGKEWERGFFWTGYMALRQLLSACRTPGRLTLRSLQFVFLFPRENYGPVDNKIEAMSFYRQALVIENSEEYMSEKLLDAICAGCIPIYVGANPNDFDIPDNLVVRCPPQLEAVVAGIQRAGTIDYETWKIQAREWLSDPNVLGRRKAVAVMGKVAARISLNLSTHTEDRPESKKLEGEN